MAQGSRETEITDLLRRWSSGDREAAEELLPLVYDELRHIAASQLRQERSAHTLQPTALVHEAYLRLSEQSSLRWPSRTHFYAFASHLIRRVLVDHARNRNRTKRGGELQRILVTEMEALAEAGESPDLVALDDALTTLEKLDPQKASVVELRFFAGLSIEETAAHLGVSTKTVNREWRRAKAWLYNELHSEPG